MTIDHGDEDHEQMICTDHEQMKGCPVKFDDHEQMKGGSATRQTDVHLKPKPGSPKGERSRRGFDDHHLDLKSLEDYFIIILMMTMMNTLVTVAMIIII